MSAAEGGRVDLVKFLAGDGFKDWDWRMEEVQEEKMEFEELGSFYDWDLGMEGAARGGHFSEATRASGTSGVDLVLFFIEKGAGNWNLGMAAAAEGGHVELVKFFVEKGAIPTDEIRRKFNL